MTLKVNRTAWIIICCAVCVLCGACGDAVTVAHVSPPGDYIRRTSEFVAAATVLLGESRVTWGQGIRALYYAGLTLARMNDHSGFANHDGSVHEEAWRQAPTAARRLFRDRIRPMRNRYDYDVSPPPDEPVAEDVAILLSEGPAAFAALLRSADAVIERRYRCEQPKRLCEQCEQEGGQVCKARLDREALAQVQQELTVLFSGPIQVIARGEPADSSAPSA